MHFKLTADLWKLRQSGVTPSLAVCALQESFPQFQHLCLLLLFFNHVPHKYLDGASYTLIISHRHTHSVPLFIMVDLSAICPAWLPIQFYLLPLVCSLLGEILRTCVVPDKPRALLNRLCAQTSPPRLHFLPVFLCQHALIASSSTHSAFSITCSLGPCVSGSLIYWLFRNDAQVVAAVSAYWPLWSRMLLLMFERGASGAPLLVNCPSFWEHPCFSLAENKWTTGASESKSKLFSCFGQWPKGCSVWRLYIELS